MYNLPNRPSSGGSLLHPELQGPVRWV